MRKYAFLRRFLAIPISAIRMLFASALGSSDHPESSGLAIPPRRPASLVKRKSLNVFTAGLH
jgi:hypothetical protein